MNRSTRLITYTAVLLALTLLFQSLRIIFPALALVSFGPFNLLQLIVGTLVNLCLFVSVWQVGLTSGLLLSVIAPIVAFMSGQLPIPHMIAVVALGNIALCVVAWIPSLNRIVSMIGAAVAKFALMAVLVLYLVIPVLLPAAVSEAPKVAKITAALSAAFVWPQLIAALAAGVLAIIICPRLPKLPTRKS